MENQVREMLHDRAEDIRLEPDIPKPLVRRARKRRLLNAAVAATTALAVVAGAVVAFSAVIDARGNSQIAETNTPSPTPSTEPSQLPPVGSLDDQVPAVWPETNLQGVAEAQARHDAGEIEWRSDLGETGREFASQVLGWPLEKVSTLYSREQSVGPSVITITDGSRDEAREVSLTLAKLGDRGPEGVWSVIEVRTDGLTINPSGMDCPPGPPQRGDGSYVCVAIEGFTSARTIDSWIFQGNDVDIGATDQVVVGGFDIPITGSTLQIPMTEGGLSKEASILLVLLRDENGEVIAAHTERVVDAEPSAGWAGIWPYNLPEDAEAAQAEADAGNPEYDWMLEVEGFLERFGTEELEWDVVSFDDSLDITGRDESGPLTIFMKNCAHPEPATSCIGDPAAWVTVERLLRRDRTGIWLVTAAVGVEIQYSTPPPSELDPQEGLPRAVADMRQAIYDAATAGDYEALRPMINTEPLPYFPEIDGTFQFSLGDVDDGRPVEERAIDFWQSHHPQGRDLLDIMAAVLTTDYSVVQLDGATLYAWPFLVGMSPDEIRNITEEQRAQLRRVYSDEEIDLIIESADAIGGHAAWRLGIDEDGRWIYFIAGE